MQKLSKLLKVFKKKFKFSQEQYIYILAGIVFLTALILAAWFGAGSLLPNSAKNIVLDSSPVGDTQAQCEFRRRLDGVCVKSDRYVDPDVVTIMVENNYEAWPLSGLSGASIVYEVPVEGSIPRFLLVYAADTEVDKIGPVRSARPYFLDWQSEYGSAMYMHVGGSPDALQKINEYNLYNINEFNHGKYFWRSTDRSRPHNTYTSSKLWDKANKDYGKFVEKESYESWIFEDMVDCLPTKEVDEKNCVNKISGAFRRPDYYDFSWEYSSTTGQYIRYQGENLQIDVGGTVIVADTVVVLRAKTKVLDEIGRISLNSVGEGKATVFRNGHKLVGTWEKASRFDRIKFYNKYNEIIPLKAGKIWIEVLGQNGVIETSI
jgi:hypothetical protein